jgi:homoserine O-acetyltransferase/O-succinyltransferase
MGPVFQGQARQVVTAARAALAALLASSCCPQQLAAIGDLPLENGAVLRDCRIGYRTYGVLDAARSNAVLVPAWSMGTAAQVAAQIGPGKLIDSRRHFVIAVDPLGNGVSSSPSNSRTQPGARFPGISIADMVEAQHRLVTRVLGLQRLEAVVGVSLGGMQAFQWATAHPTLVDEVVAIASSPRTTPAEQRQWKAWSDEVASRSRWGRAAHALGDLAPLGAIRQLGLDAGDYRAQAGAIARHDISARFGGSLPRAAAAIRARMLVVVSQRDEVVDPAGARELARLTGAQLVELDGRCGHSAPSCEKDVLRRVVSEFLDR